MELTDREIQVLTYIAEGLSNEEIAKKMGMYQVQVSRSSTKGLKKLKKILQETP